ncbi:MAG: diaminobutyrate--2-oxoglutarate transaminase [Mesorhizobium sp.]|uniref:Diaminobutyrate--2-oxoglutarate transaminase n=1 Tax=Mesorhizobium wenxiniae TaxID=2014805 RepID=A0A271KR71_9HYPH|nr:MULTISPECIES: diaminobutyrate--2-oxoglutarate transaminase [Mesorhizobium]MCF6114628.1 diaminobutyrate--2-oxoglutarate transaminase [Mesorhizobium muleiense]PAP97519.1 diaminobutyrate--2-oxoglutarate transaminase [Mesorhizobium wenxiniae]RVD13138.1 diaminobutyrate--2-oxoglutarate transaminase [Mesorhizobium sp. M7A.F.Ca.ET.027.02.1.1]RWC97378.1 MAG: diaminobutyrate--2-oxoglutarate transaminase [Mesorhizobium sp.]RWD40595.1 MAG: diaminobutyrate--2-oxoglutarate transaminase [Mesorhizobium sp.
MLEENTSNSLLAFETLESNVRAYSRTFPVVFRKAAGAILEDENGSEFIDFLSGAGVLNYGHNDSDFLNDAKKYLESGGIIHGLDMATSAKREFMEYFDATILRPRDMTYKFQFPGPTGANAVEAALKLARKATGRQTVISFTNGFHGVSLGALAVTGNRTHRGAAGLTLVGAVFMPYDGYWGADQDTSEYLGKVLADASSGVDLPAAIILETVQGEGGINPASKIWLQSLELLCRRNGVLLIVDDIQAGCGRTGSFFSFEFADLSPDIIVLSKSLSGCGLPLSLLLLKPEIDVWQPGEHNGTFRGNNLALVTGASALRKYWTDEKLSHGVTETGRILNQRLQQIAQSSGDPSLSVRGRGMMLGLDCNTGKLAEKIVHRAFEGGLVVERCGAEDQVVKLLPPLTIDGETLQRGLDILDSSVHASV